jgi:FkbM family methyltransferase
LGRDIGISAPTQTGVLNSFVEVVLDDSYGLSSLKRQEIETVLDIGGNVGFFAIAARNTFRNAVIHVYEPNPIVHSYLDSHAREIGCVIFPEAVGGAEATVSLSDHEDLVQVQTRVDRAGTITQIPFRLALSRIGGHCDLVKMDCEGAEWDILSDVDAWRNVDYLAMEYHLWRGNHQHSDVPDLLRNIGFALRRQILAGRDFGITWATRIKK